MKSSESFPTANQENFEREADSENESVRIVKFVPQVIEHRNYQLGPEGDGPPDIFFGPDIFSNKISDEHEQYSDAFHEKIEQGEIKVGDHVLTMDDLDRPLSEIFPGLNNSNIEENLRSILGDIEPKRYE